MIRQDPNQLREQAARRLLRRLRDLNFGDGTIRVTGGEEVRITGCTSLDHPVERGVRYRLSFEGGETKVVELEWSDGRLHTRLFVDPAEEPATQTSFGLNGHPAGLVELSGLHSAINLSSASSEDFEALLGRIVGATVEVA